MPERKEKIIKLIKILTANYLLKENNKSSLITVTSVNISNDFKKSTIFISVLPTDKEKTALLFAKRKKSEIREYLKKNLNMKRVPFIEIEIDKGEKNRQRIDELLRN